MTPDITSRLMLELQRNIDGLQKDRTNLTTALIDAWEFIRKRADVNHNGDGPNQAMSLAASTEEVLKSVGVTDE